MRILKTYARLFVDDLDAALPIYQQIVGTPPDLRVGFEEAEIAAIGDFLLIAGPPEAVDRYRSTIGPVIVDDLDESLALLTALGARLTGGPMSGPTGRLAYLDHPDGTNVEYVEWSESVRVQVLG